MHEKLNKTNLKWLAVAAAMSAFIAISTAARADTLNLTGDVLAGFPAPVITGTFSTDSSVGSVVYADNVFKTSGTGAIDSFLRVQNTGVEQGYNTSANNVFNDKGGSFTHDLSFGSLTATGGYYQFSLDINQLGNDPYISLDEVQIYKGATGQSNEAFNGNGTLALNGSSTLLYRMDSTANNTILLKNDSGSGAGEMFMFVPTSVFSGVSSGDNIILYSHWGGLGTLNGVEWTANDGFEEWADIVGAPPPGAAAPEPATILSLATMAMGFGACYVYRRNRCAKS